MSGCIRDINHECFTGEKYGAIWERPGDVAESKGLLNKAGPRMDMFCLDVQLHQKKYSAINSMNKL